LVVCITASLVEANGDKFVQRYLESLIDSRTPVFYSACQLKEGTAALLLPLGERKGVFIEKTQQAVVNTADVSWVDGRWSLAEAMGGVWTITRISYLTEELLRFPFRLVPPENLTQVASSRPNRVCKERLP
jgi:hypothetical protein